MMEVKEIDINKLVTSKFNPRLDLGDLTGLVESIKRRGIEEPLIVREKDGKYEVVIGERRFRAAEKALSKTAPCLIKNYTDIEAAEASFDENMHRKDLTPIERATSIKSQIDYFPEEYPTQKAFADKYGIDESTLSTWLSILDFPYEVKDLIGPKRGQIDLRAAYAVMRATTSEITKLPRDKAVKLIQSVAKKNFTHSQVLHELEDFLRKNSNTGPDKPELLLQNSGSEPTKREFISSIDWDCSKCHKHMAVYCDGQRHKIEVLGEARR